MPHKTPEGLRLYRARTKERRKVVRSTWYAENRERLRARKRASYALNKEKIKARLAEPGTAREKRLAQKRAHHAANKDKEREYRRRPEVKAAANERSLRFRAENPEKQRQYEAKHLSNRVAELEALAGRPRPTVCEVCGRPNYSGRAIGYDHCHQHGHFRGWLCNACNAALGHVEDDVRILQKLIEYLQRDPGMTAEEISVRYSHNRRRIAIRRRKQ